MHRSPVLGTAFVLIWSSGYVVGAIAAHAAAALAVTFWRLLVAGVILGALALVRGVRWPREPRVLAGIALVGALLFGVQFGGLYLGLAGGMPAGTQALLVSACPLVVALTQAGLGSERLAGRQWLGAALGIGGVVVALLGHLSSPGAVGPLLWTLLGVAAFAAATVLTPRLVPPEADVRAVTSIECLVAGVVLLPWALLHGGLAVPLTGPAVGSAVWLTLVNGVGGSLLILALVQTRGATRATSLLYAVPAVTALASWPVLGEPIGVPTLAGLAIAGLGIVLVQYRPPSAPVERSAVALEPVASTMVE